MERKINLKIVICYHKASRIISNSIYLPVQVGKASAPVTLSMQSDNEGVNISDRNCLYCELTGLYWAWKNLSADYIGLAHYRRIYSFTPVIDRFCSIFGWGKYCIYRLLCGLTRACENIMFYPLIKTLKNDLDLNTQIQEFEQGIVSYISKHPDKKLFTLHPVRIGNLTNLYFFAMVGGYEHIRMIKDIVKEDYPAFYPYLEKTLKKNKLFYANMTIMKKEVFDEYCMFLFGVLDRHYTFCLNENYYHSKEEKGWSRLSGYMGELLTSTFILYYHDHNRKSIKKLSMVKIDF